MSEVVPTRNDDPPTAPEGAGPAPARPGDPIVETVHEATPAELATWDARAVDARGGHVLQSLAWGAHRAGIGLRIRHLMFGDGSPLLALERPWPFVGGSSAYLSRGPAGGEPPGLSARRVEAAAAWLAERGADVTAADPEIPEDSAYGDLIRGRGWRRIEELWQSRHRMTRPIEPGEDEAGAFAEIGRSTRQRIRGAEHGGLAVLRFDPGILGGDGPVQASADRRGMDERDETVDAGDGFIRPSEPLAPALERFYGWLVSTGDRLGFEVGTPAEHVAWWRAAAAAGHLLYLEVRTEAEPIGGLVVYRHGDRLTTVSSADRAETRRAHPGALHLLRWRALQLAIREGRRELDMGGVDVPGARDEPREGDPMYGLYQHKRAFGARWLALTGAHEKVARPGRYLAGRVIGRAARLAGGRR